MRLAFDIPNRRIATGVASLLGLLFIHSISALAASDILSGLSGSGPAPSPSLWQQFLALIGQLQFSLQQGVVGAVQALKANGSMAPAWTLIALAFLYGILHAIGPGHGKVVISSYLISHHSQLRRGILLALLSSLVQALSAIALVSVLVILLGLPRLEATARVKDLEIVSYGLIVAVGLGMLVSALRGRHGCDHRSPHPDHEHPDHNGGQDRPREPPASLRQLAAVVLAVGIRPCSGAIILLLFTLSQAMLAVGIAAVFMMSLGTALTVSALALFTVLSRRAVVRLAGAATVWENRIHQGLAIAGSLAVMLFGGALLLATLGQPGTL